MVYAREPVETGSPRTFPGRPLPTFSDPHKAYAVGQKLLNRAENLDLRRVKSAAMRIYHSLRDLPNLDMAVLRKAHHQRPGSVGTDPEPLGQQPGRYADLLPPGQRVLELCNLGLQLGHSGISVCVPGNQASLFVR
jgi:hypothetical protein